MPWQGLWVLSLEVVSTSPFPLGTPVCSGARDPWQERALACVLTGRSFPCSKCRPGSSVRRPHVCLAGLWFPAVCVRKAFISFRGVTLKGPGLWLFRAQVNMAYQGLRSSRCWKGLLHLGLSLLLPKFKRRDSPSALSKVRLKPCESPREPRGWKTLHVRGSFPENRATRLENTHLVCCDFLLWGRELLSVRW